MVKVCHFTSVHQATDGRIFEKECCSLAKAGYDVYLVAPNAKKEIKNGVHIVGVSIPNRGRLYRILCVTKLIYKKAVSLNADVYHFHDPELLIYGLMLKRRGKKVIFDSHEDVVNQMLQKKYLLIFTRIAATFYECYEKYIVSRLDAVISVTPHIVERLKQINPATYQITNYPIISSRKEYNSYDKHTYIAFAGGITPMWMHDKVIGSMSFVFEKSLQYKIAGTISNDYLGKLKMLNNWKSVNYLGFLNSKEVKQLYTHAVLGIALLDYVPNVGGHIGTLGNNKIFEMMAAGIPVICTDFELWKDIVDKWKCGICVNPHDLSMIANAINEIIANPVLAQTMGNNGVDAIYVEYNWSSQERILLDLYNSVTNEYTSH